MGITHVGAGTYPGRARAPPTAAPRPDALGRIVPGAAVERLQDRGDVLVHGPHRHDHPMAISTMSAPAPSWAATGATWAAATEGVRADPADHLLTNPKGRHMDPLHLLRLIEIERRIRSQQQRRTPSPRTPRRSRRMHRATA